MTQIQNNSVAEERQYSEVASNRRTGLGLLLLLAASLQMACRNDEPYVQPEGQGVYTDGVHSFVPDSGFVPDSSAAVKVAEAILIPIYGESAIRQQRPLVAELNDSVWTVTGTLPPDYLGGVALIQLLKADARVLRVSHGM